MSAATSLEKRIDELYQLPLDEFTPARNALAKEFSGDAGARVKALVKPSLPMWAINQLHWKDPASYKALIDASEKLRAAHRAALNGRKADTRAADRLHQSAVERAIARTLGILKRTGIPLSDAAMQGLRSTMAALPTDEKEGRLTREPPPAGFSLLTGIKPRDLSKPNPSHVDPSQVDPSYGSGFSWTSGRTPSAEDQKAAVKRAEKERLKQQTDEERRAKEARAKELKAQQERVREEIKRATEALEEAKRKLARLGSDPN